jgi:hypothetical protein
MVEVTVQVGNRMQISLSPLSRRGTLLTPGPKVNVIPMYYPSSLACNLSAVKVSLRRYSISAITVCRHHLNATLAETGKFLPVLPGRPITVTKC